jgi:hypothetical protein
MHKRDDNQTISPPARVGRGGGTKGTATKWTDYINHSRDGADRRGINFEIDAAYIEQLFNAQDGKCAISGLPLWIDRKYLNPTASLDRKDSARGYVKCNVQWVHKVVNSMKLHHDERYFIAMCMKIAEHRGGGESLTQAQRQMLAGQPFTSKDRPKNLFPQRKIAPPPEQLQSVGGMLF